MLVLYIYPQNVQWFSDSVTPSESLGLDLLLEVL